MRRRVKTERRRVKTERRQVKTERRQVKTERRQVKTERRQVKTGNRRGTKKFSHDQIGYRQTPHNHWRTQSLDEKLQPEPKAAIYGGTIVT